MGPGEMAGGCLGGDGCRPRGLCRGGIGGGAGRHRRIADHRAHRVAVRRARSASPGQSTHTVTVASVSRSWIEYVPKGYDGETARPVVITLHGLGSDGTQQLAATGWTTIADRDNVVVLAPDALGKPAQWDLLTARRSNADVDFVEAMLVSVAERLCVASRISLNGISNGSAFVATLTCALGDRVRTVAFVATTSTTRLR